MPWKRDKSIDRITADLARLDENGGVVVEKLVREMDLDNLTDKKCREIFGAHVYVNITNFPEYASAPTKDNDYKKFIRGVHVYQRVTRHIVESIFDAAFVHFQGPKLHALVYRPIDDAKKIADKAVLLQLAMADFVGIFNDATKADVGYAVASGSDIGDVIGTRNGDVKERETLFIGPPANNAAKLIATGVRLTKAIYDVLSDDVKAFCSKTSDEAIYLAKASVSDFDKAMTDREMKWDRDALRKMVEDEEGSVPLTEIEYSDANEKIKPDSLSIRNNKRVLAISVFADVSGFTAYVASKTTDAGKAKALRALQAIRRESSVIARSDYDGVRIQYQGDRIQAIYHMPKRDDAAIALEALKAACAMQSAMEDTLRECLPDIDDIHYAIGLDIGETLVTKLGTHGDRDRVCLGTAVENAQILEDKTAGPKDIVVSKAVLDLLPKYARDLFKSKGTAYVANNLTLENLELAQKLEMPAKEVGVEKSSVGFSVTSPHRGTPVKTGSSWQA